MEPTAQTVFVIGATDSQLMASIEKLRIPCRHFEALDEVFEATDSNSRGCVIANLQLFGIGGFDALLQLAKLRNTLPVIIMSNQVSIRMVVRAMREGASTVLETPVSNEDLFFAVRDALKENDLRRSEHLQTSKLMLQFGRLTAGEQQVMDQLCRGLNNKEIAMFLNIHVRTVEARKKRLLEKTQCDSFAQLLIAYHTFRNSTGRLLGYDQASDHRELSAV